MTKENQEFQLFTKNWGIYQKVIEHNYMFHKEFKDEVTLALKQISAQRPIKVLDLGCGDANFITDCLSSIPVEHYTGFDSSATVLKFAAENLERNHISYDLKIGNMEDLILEEGSHFDFIFSSYAVHHLQDENKLMLIKNCFDRLKYQGSFLLIDIFRSQNESRDAYIDRYSNWILNDWAHFDISEKQALIDHLSAFDFPSDYDYFQSAIQQIGFSSKPTNYVDNTHKMLLFTKW